MSAPIGSMVGPVRALSEHELDETCAICNRRRGDHLGRSGTYCPDDGGGWAKTSTFVGSNEHRDAPHSYYQTAAMLHARATGGPFPVYRARRGQALVGGQPVPDCVVGWELANEAELFGGQR